MLGLWYRSPNSGRVPRDPKNSLFRTTNKRYCSYNDLKTTKITNKHRRKTQEAESHGMVWYSKHFIKVYKSK